MRFLIGLLAGAALVFTLLPLLDLRPTEIVEAFRAQWALSRSVPAVSEALLDVDPLPESSVTPEEQPPPPEPIEPAAIVAPEGVGKLLQHSVGADLSANAERKINDLQEVRGQVRSHSASQLTSATAFSAITTDVDDSDFSDHLETRATDAAADADAGWQSVWTPFYSEMSAAGFARRLADTTERSFTVRKEAPGRYQVVFAYADEQERSQVLEAFSAATGVQTP